MQILTSLQEKMFQGMTSRSAADGDLEGKNQEIEKGLNKIGK